MGWYVGYHKLLCEKYAQDDFRLTRTVYECLYKLVKALT